MENRRKRTLKTNRIATANMLRYVGALVLIALIIVIIWFLMFNPGDPDSVARLHGAASSPHG